MKQRNPMILVPIFIALAAVVYMMLLKPASERLQRNRASLLDLRREVSKRTVEIQSQPTLEARLGAVEEEIGSFAPLCLEPLLESYAMQAKAIVGGFAEQAGLVDVEFAERPVRMLPVLKGRPVPSTLHARRPILITCSGDYAAIVSFILRVERDLPHVALGALGIRRGEGQEALQRAEIVLEWPSKGEVRK